MTDKPIIGWFSCGATSAVACKIGLSMYKNVRIVHIETGSEHPDNIRFLKDCEEWYGCKIETIRSDKYSCVEDVLLRKKFINGPMGASCTKELKKRVRYSFEDVLGEWGGANLGVRFLQRRDQQSYQIQTTKPKNKAIIPSYREDAYKTRLPWNII